MFNNFIVEITNEKEFVEVVKKIILFYKKDILKLPDSYSEIRRYLFLTKDDTLELVNASQIPSYTPFFSYHSFNKFIEEQDNEKTN